MTSYDEQIMKLENSMKKEIENIIERYTIKINDINLQKLKATMDETKKQIFSVIDRNKIITNESEDSEESEEDEEMERAKIIAERKKRNANNPKHQYMKAICILRNHVAKEFNRWIQCKTCYAIAKEIIDNNGMDEPFTAEDVKKAIEFGKKEFNENIEVFRKRLD